MTLRSLRPLLAAACFAVALPLFAQNPAGAKFAVKGYSAPIPASWVAEAPASPMRAGQYRVPGAATGGEAEVIAFHFPPGQGGTVEANIERWASQFTSPDGRPINPRIQKFKVGGVPVTFVELHGNYSRGVGMGPEGQAKPNQTLLVAIAETPDGRFTFQMHGPRATVAGQRKAFEAMVRGLKKG
jgi:hypothetical protein